MSNGTVDVTCPVCRSAGARGYDRVSDRWFGSAGVWSVLRCTDCDCWWLADAGGDWTGDGQSVGDGDSAVDSRYASYYTHEVEAPRTGGRRLFWRLFPSPWAARRSRLRSAMIPGSVPPVARRVLDVGCGAGLGLRAMREAGWDPVGFEVDPVAARVAADTSGCEVLTGRLADLTAASFDVVLSSHVIEHLDDLDEFIAQCRRILAPGGRFIAYTPNTASWTRRVFGSRWRGFEVPRHRVLLGPRSAAALCRRAGMHRYVVTADPNMDGMLTASSLFGGTTKSSAAQKVAFYVAWLAGQAAGDAVSMVSRRSGGELLIEGSWRSEPDPTSPGHSA